MDHQGTIPLLLMDCTVYVMLEHFYERVCKFCFRSSVAVSLVFAVTKVGVMMFLV